MNLTLSMSSKSFHTASLRRTEACGRLLSAIHVLRRQPLSLSLEALGLVRFSENPLLSIQMNMKTSRIERGAAKIGPTRRFLQIIILAFCTMNMPAPNGYASAAGKELYEAGAALSSTYEKVFATITEPKERSLFVASQEAWIKDRDASVAFFSQRYPYSKDGLFYNVHLIKERTKFFKALLATSPKVDPEGVKADGCRE